MTLLIIFLVIALGLQVGLFFVIRSKKKKERQNNVLIKYNINSPADAFKKMNDMTIPESDRLEIERLYQGENP